MKRPGRDLVHRPLEVSEEPRNVLDCVDRHRAGAFVEKAVRFVERSGGLGGVIETDVAGFRPEPARERGLANLAGAGNQGDRELRSGYCEGGG